MLLVTISGRRPHNKRPVHVDLSFWVFFGVFWCIVAYFGLFWPFFGHFMPFLTPTKARFLAKKRELQPQQRASGRGEPVFFVPTHHPPTWVYGQGPLCSAVPYGQLAPEAPSPFLSLPHMTILTITGKGGGGSFTRKGGGPLRVREGGPGRRVGGYFFYA